MSEFLVSAACKGRRPERVLGRRLVSRPDLVARLLRERHVARFIVAPSGFGKSSLAFEYAETVYAFQHVFWVRCGSPCFLRDLDAGSIFSRLQSLDSSRFLVVFEDVPRFDSERAEAFSLLIDALLDANDEVLVTCAPSSDAYRERHRDRMKLGSRDLLLTDAELSTLRFGLRDDGERYGMVGASLADRIPCLCWGDDDGSLLMRGLVEEELPGDVQLVMLVMLALREGSCSDLEAFVSAGKVHAAVQMLAESYPMMGADPFSDRYRTISVTPEALARVFDVSVDIMARVSVFEKRDALAQGLADALLARGEDERACGLLAAMASKPACAAWLVRREFDLLKCGCLLPAHGLFERIGRSKGDLKASLNCGEAWRLFLLDEKDEALSFARKTAFSSKEPARVRALCLLLLCAHSQGELREKALSALSLLMTSESHMRVTQNGKVQPCIKGGADVWEVVACVTLALGRGAFDGVAAWTHCRAAECSDDALNVAATFLLETLSRVKRPALATPAVRDALAVREASTVRDASAAHEVLSVHSILSPVASYAREMLSRVAAEDVDFVLARMAFALSRACENGALPVDYAPCHTALVAARGFYLRIHSQKVGLSQQRERANDQSAEFRATHPDAFRAVHKTRDAKPVTKVAPVMHVRLFGGLEVKLGEVVVDPFLFRRRKMKTLLAVLVLNKGREMSRDRLVSLLWPDSEIETARKNLYSLWSQLKRALSDEEGSCPYLIRERGGCRLDARFVSSDVEQFEEMCRLLLFGRVELDDFERVQSLIKGHFADDLLPSEQDNEFIVATRDEYRVHMVDALIAASSKLVVSGKVRGGLWFAREALRRDATREDVHVALMEAQIAAGQRGAALETYFALRKYLAEELGIDPSMKTVRLYRDIIESEDVVDW